MPYTFVDRTTASIQTFPTIDIPPTAALFGGVEKISTARPVKIACFRQVLRPHQAAGGIARRGPQAASARCF